MLPWLYFHSVSRQVLLIRYLLILLIPLIIPPSFLSIFNLHLPLYFPSLLALLPTNISPSRQMAFVSTLWPFGRTTFPYSCSKTKQRAFVGHVMSVHIIGSSIILSYCDRTNNPPEWYRYSARLRQPVLLITAQCERPVNKKWHIKTDHFLHQWI